MGFVRANVLPLLKEHKRQPFTGHCLCLGQADVFFSYDTLKRMAHIARIALVADIPVTFSHQLDLAAKGYISRDTLFKSIGFNQVSALDYSTFEGADFKFDLNNPILPADLNERFDTIIDHGTMEHVFHVPNCLANIFGMLKVGGRIIHSAPGSNYFDHGFYMFSPTFFYDFYLANNWDLETLQIFQLDPQRQEIEPPFFADYEPGIFDTLNAGGLDNKSYGTICIATKKLLSTGNAIPQQGYYSRLADWQTGETVNIKGQPLDESSSKKIITLSPPYHHEQGNCWVIDLKKYGIKEGDLGTNFSQSSLRLFEDRCGLGPPHTLHELIRQVGSGSYSHWGTTLYFSTSDNSDPNTNGRRYQIYT